MNNMIKDAKSVIKIINNSSNMNNNFNIFLRRNSSGKNLDGL